MIDFTTLTDKFLNKIKPQEPAAPSQTFSSLDERWKQSSLRYITQDPIGRNNFFNQTIHRMHLTLKNKNISIEELLRTLTSTQHEKTDEWIYTMCVRIHNIRERIAEEARNPGTFKYEWLQEDMSDVNL